MNAIGLDIGVSFIKAVFVDEQKKQFFFKSCISAATPPRGMMSEAELDKQEMSLVIRKMVQDAKIKSNEVNIALADNQVFTKVIEMPLLSEKELASAIYWEAEQYIPASLSTITLDWKILRKTDNKNGTGSMQVFLVGAPTVLIKKYQSIIEGAGLHVASIETEIISVIRAIMREKVIATTLVINISVLSTSLAIIQNGVIVLTYSIPVGSIAMNRAIASDFGFSVQQAEEYKKTYGIGNSDPGGKIGKALEPILLSMVSEIKKALVFYSNKYKNDSPITQILLAGGSAKLPGIDLFFVRNVGIETVIANPWQIQNVRDVPQEIFDNGLEYTIALGLAIKGNE